MIQLLFSITTIFFGMSAGYTIYEAAFGNNNDWEVAIFMTIPFLFNAGLLWLSIWMED